MNKDTRIKILDILLEHYRNARIELCYDTPYQLLIAVLLSAQSTDVGVNKATQQLFAKVRSPQEMLALGREGLVQHIKSIGLYNAKAKHVMLLSQQLVDDFNGSVPKTRKTLMKLPGVGRKTANVVLNELYGKPTIAVDTHIFRVCNRSGFAPGETPLAVELKLVRYVPSFYKQNLHQWLIQLGRYICVARKPKCQQCPIFDFCDYAKKMQK